MTAPHDQKDDMPDYLDRDADDGDLDAALWDGRGLIVTPDGPIAGDDWT